MTYAENAINPNVINQLRSQRNSKITPEYNAAAAQAAYKTQNNSVACNQIGNFTRVAILSCQSHGTR
jgi:hypothetical protein